ncbi:hypothetical protein F4780DRAFT_775531 [Xylariomycetidae sp. FL0641]|nr:hypothetical protein F4780DRAFT_775531 [Xylariomycetidae sp. FL0641]
MAPSYVAAASINAAGATRTSMTTRAVFRSAPVAAFRPAIPVAFFHPTQRTVAQKTKVKNPVVELGRAPFTISKMGGRQEASAPLAALGQESGSATCLVMAAAVACPGTSTGLFTYPPWAK